MNNLGINAEQNRDHNRRIILQALRRHGALSRADLTRLTGLSPQGITNIAAVLLEEGLVHAVGRQRGGRGQPPMHLAINPQAGLTIGIEIRLEGMVGLLADLDGGILTEARIPLASAEPQSVARQLPALVASLLAGRTQRPIGIGIVMPGPFGAAQALAERPTELPGWGRMDDPAGFIEAQIGYPVLVENDATAAAIAEHLYGAGRNLARLATIYLGRGLGLGLVLDGRVYRGARGNAGEIGHVVAVPGGRACFCGQNGCLERYVSLDAALRDLNVATQSDLLASPDLAAWLDQAGRHLTQTILMIETLLDTDAVILAGLSEPLIDGLMARLHDLPGSFVRHGAGRVLRGASGPFSAARGAAALPLYAMTAPRPVPTTRFRASPIFPPVASA